MKNSGHVDFDTIKSAFIAGGNGGIGLAFVQQILKRNKQVQLFASCRSKANAHDLVELKDRGFTDRLHLIELVGEDESGYQNAAKLVSDRTDKIDAVINNIGFLHGKSGKPEKRLADIKLQHLQESFVANSIPVVMLAKHLFPLLKNPSPSIFASLSARVGSIGDNRSGGWYSYRASKAAHNMFVKNIALEMERFRCNTLTLTLHPGTTRTHLSKPFIGNTRYKLHSPDQTACNLLTVMSQKKMESSGGFFDWEGKSVEW